jgi:hypothetical protein
MNLLLIGCGGIGKRWLEGWIAYGGSGVQVDITIVEPLPCFDEIVAEKNKNSRVLVLSDIADLPVDKDFDLAVVATNSSVRNQVVSDLCDTDAHCSLVILEKNLCQSLYDLDQLTELTSSFKDVRVNCTVRHWPFSLAMRGRDFVELSVIGMDWGIGCNLIHMLDLFTFMLDQFTDKLENIVVETVTNVFDSKREGYKEFHGRVVAFSAAGRKMVCESMPGTFERKISLRSKDQLITWDNKFLHISNTRDGFKPYYCPEIYQSEFSREWLHLIASGEAPPLSNLSAVSSLTREMLIAFGPVFISDSDNLDLKRIIPIT